MCVAQVIALVVDTGFTYMLPYAKVKNKFIIELLCYYIFEPFYALSKDHKHTDGCEGRFRSS